jgi:hypothetical protein
MPTGKKANFELGKVPSHLRKEALGYLLLMRKITWKEKAILRLTFHKEHSYRAKQTLFHRGRETLRITLEDQAQRAIHNASFDQRIALVNEELNAYRAQAEIQRTSLRLKIREHLEMEREQAYAMMGIIAAELPNEEIEDNRAGIQLEVFDILGSLGKQLVKVRVEASEEHQRWEQHQNQRAAQQQARLQAGDHEMLQPEPHPAQAPAQQDQARRAPTLQELVQKEVQHQLNRQGRGKRGSSAQRRTARPKQQVGRHRNRSRSRSRSMSRSTRTRRSRSSSRVSFRTARRSRTRSRTPSRGRRGAGRTGSDPAGRGNRGRGRGWGRGRRGRGRGRF